METEWVLHPLVWYRLNKTVEIKKKHIPPSLPYITGVEREGIYAVLSATLHLTYLSPYLI